MSRFIIDVREPSEYASGHVDGALNIPPQELLNGSAKLISIAKNDELILYCKSGSRSNASQNILESMGYTNIINGINQDHVRAKYGL